MSAVLNWTCDFCKKGHVTIYLAGVLYCDMCRMSYGETITDKMLKNARRENFDDIINFFGLMMTPEQLEKFLNGEIANMREPMTRMGRK